MSDREPYRADESKARAVLDDMMAVLRRDVGAAELQQPRANENLQRIIREWATDPEWLESGEFLSRILRLPQGWAQTCLECVNEERAYRGSNNFKIVKSRVLNFSPHPVDVLTDIKTYAKYTPDGSTKRDEWDEVKEFAAIEAGTVRQMSRNWSINALFAKSRDAWPVYQWRTWPHHNDCLREVGYVVEVDQPDGDTVRIDSNQFKRNRIAEALTLADERLASAEFDAALSAVADVSHLLIDGAPDPRVEGKRAEIVTAREMATTKSERTRRPGRPRKATDEE